MGRFSSVQAFADNHNAVRKVAYEDITRAATTNTGTGSSVQNSLTTTNVPSSTTTTNTTTAYVAPEKVVNPYGSTAGAGSGDFHVYRHSRNRELLRQKHMEEVIQEEHEDKKYYNEIRSNQLWEEERTAKRRKKRERLKNAKKRKENLIKAGIHIQTSNHSNNMLPSTNDDDDETSDEEFHYQPGDALIPISTDTTSKDNNLTNQIISKEGMKHSTIGNDIPNDGSFLEMMKQKLLQKQSSSDDPP